MTSMIANQNDWTIFFRRPISGVVMVLTILALAFPAFRALRQRAASRNAVRSGTST
jgi:putative tricarboxylic transport membrane protein